MSSVFISLVGTQVMGTLQPWLAVAEKDRDMAVYLLATPAVRPLADKLRDYAATHALGEVCVLDIPDSLDAPGACAEQARALAEAAEKMGKRVIFNLNGGQNYMIVACVLALALFDIHLVQASAWRVVLSGSESSCILPLPAPLPPADLLALQEVAWEPVSLTEWNVPQFCERGELDLPQHALCGVRIDGVLFDVVWNPGTNRLCFLVNCMYPPNDGEQRKATERNIAHWASARGRSAHLYDRQVFALVQNDMSEERLKNEAAGKLDVLNVQGWRNNSQVLRTELGKLFRKAPLPSGVLSEPKPTAFRPLPDNTLIVCMGTNVVPTLVAIATHKPDHVVLCYTKGNKGRVESYAGKLQELAPDMGISLTLVPVNAEGLFLERLLPEPAANARVHVNITPGTKGQGAMLALWAMRHNAAVWSLDNRRRTAEPLHAPRGESSRPLLIGDPTHCFQVTGQRIKDPGNDVGALASHMPFLDELLKFMRQAEEEGRGNELLCGSLRIGTAELARVDRKCWELRLPGKAHSFSLEGGEWFERLTAVAFFRAGAHIVRQRVRIAWTENTEHRVEAKHPEADVVFRLDIDVAGAWGPDMFLVSCKSNPYGPVEPAAVEAAHTGTSLGRFSLRFLAHMGCNRPFLHAGGAMVLGWRELCRPEALRAAFENLRRAQSTFRA